MNNKHSRLIDCCAAARGIACTAMIIVCFSACASAADVSPPSEDPLAVIYRRSQNVMDPLERLEIHLAIARSYWQRGERALARGILAETLHQADLLPDPFSRAILLSRLSRCYLDCNDTAQATVVAQAIPLSDSRADALYAVITTLLQQERYEAAWAIASAIDDPFGRAMAITALQQSRWGTAGFRRAALQRLLRGSGGKTHRAVRMIGLGYIGRSVNIPPEFLVGADNPFRRARGLVELIKGFIATNTTTPALRTLEAALKTISLIPRQFPRSELHIDLAAIAARLGAYEKAEAIAGDIPVAMLRDEAYGRICAQYLAERNESGARRIIEGIASSPLRDALLGMLVPYHVRDRDFAAALSAAARIADPVWQYMALIAIASGIDPADDESKRLFVTTLAVQK